MAEKAEVNGEAKKKAGVEFNRLARVNVAINRAMNRLWSGAAVLILLAGVSAAIAQSGAPETQASGIAGSMDRSALGRDWPAVSEIPDAPKPIPLQAGGDPTNNATGEFALPRAVPMGKIAGLPTFDSADWSTSAEAGSDPIVEPAAHSMYVPLKDCPRDEMGARECRMHWGPMVLESVLFNAFEDGGNIYTGYWYRHETLTGKWWDRYVASVQEWRWSRWSDNNPLLDDYVGHPMMGAITNSIWIQNDPKGMTLEFANDRAYWRSRMRALAWSTFYSFEWKLGPTGEAAVGHNGDHFFFDHGVLTNETGWVELVTTPVGGLGWTIAEDYLDKHVVRKLEDKSRNPVLLTMYNFLTPARGFANILRFRPPWYRDSRIVKANSFWSDPGEGVSASTADAMRYASRHHDSKAEAYLGSVERVPEAAPSNWQGPGGKHEFGAWWGMSVMSGHIWGFAGDVKYMPIDLRYSYELYRHHESWTMRYSPEMTALAMLDWPTPNQTSTGTEFNQRKRVYGSGVSPAGFQMVFLPLHRLQPFFSTDGGFIYFSDRVLSPQGSRFMYTIDYGAGLNIFHHKNQAITIGYRYQHLSNANISQHNPGTDANTFYVGVSRFRTKGNQRAERDLR
ncbi:MAG: acyloxyacyl hydrolase [Terracidiphilus sp.]